MVDLVSKALEVAEEYPVFPCDAKKRPVCEGGFKAATQDPTEVERLFSVPNAALIGMPTGEASGVSVIDIDIRDNKNGKAWKEDNQELLATLGSLRRFLEDGIFTIFIVVVFVIAPGLLGVWMSVVMVAMSFIQRVLVIVGSTTRSFAISPMPLLLSLPMFLMILAVIN